MAMEPEEFFDERSGEWTEHYSKEGYLSHFFRTRKREIARLVPRSRGGKLLDAGCGTGDFVPVAQERGYSFRGIDISKRMIDICRKRFPGTGFSKGDVMDLGFPEGEFDAVISAGVLEYVKDDSRASLELFRVIKEGGILIATFPNRSSPLLRIEKLLGRLSPREKAFHREYTASQARTLLESAGFRITDDIFVSYLPVNIGVRIPFPRAFDRVLGAGLRVLGLGSWGLTHIIRARR